VSGIDAFSLEDSTPVWSRRFTEPIASPIAVNDGSIYFSLSFESEAIVASKGLFYTLDARNGKTISERAVAGALNGFVPGMPMPDDAGRLLLADRLRPVIYILNRSAFRRMF
jgi:outer membrane protein assembly factor BamB